MEAYLGVDWSSTEVVCAVGTADGGVVRLGRVARTLEAAKAVIQRARDCCEGAEVHAIIEAGSMSWVWLFHAAGAVVHIVDPKQAARFAESLSSSGAKDDPRDACALVAFGRGRKLGAWTPPNEAQRRLERALAQQEALTNKRSRETQQLREDLKVTQPELEDAIDELDAKWARALLKRVPTARHAQTLKREALERIMSGARRATIDRVWTALQQPCIRTLTAFEAEDEACTVRESLARLAQFDANLERVTTLIDHVLEAFEAAATIDAIPGIGTKLTAAVVAYGAVDGDRDASAVRMGAAPVFRGSGRTRDGQSKGVTVMRRSCSSAARRAVYMLGRAAVANLPWARAQFAASKARGKRAGTAYRQVVRSLLRLINSLVHNRCAYDDARYVAGLKQRGVAWAAAL